MNRPKSSIPLRRKLAAYSALYLEGLGVTNDRPLRGPIYAQISVSDLCNHQCVMCPYHPPGQDSNRTGTAFAGTRPGLMSLEKFRTLANELHRLGTLQLDLVGRGEPLLNKACPEMIAYASQLGMDVSLTTNASRLTPRLAEELVDAGLKRLKISLNAGLPETYSSIHVTESSKSYRTVVRNIRELKRIREAKGKDTPHITISFTIVQANFQELVEMLDRVEEAGADAAWFQHVIDDSSFVGVALDKSQQTQLREVEIPRALAHASRLPIEHNLADFVRSSPPGDGDGEGEKPIPCYIGSFFTSVLGNGEVVPCCQINHSVGSLDSDDFSTIWKSEEYRSFRHAARHLPDKAPILKTAECDKCYFRSHNETIHSILYPLSKSHGSLSSPLIPLRHLLKMKRTDKPERS